MTKAKRAKPSTEPPGRAKPTSAPLPGLSMPAPAPLPFSVPEAPCAEAAPIKPAQPIKAPKIVELPVNLQRDMVLDTAQVAKLIGYSVPHLRRLYRSGVIPAPMQINGRKMGWRTGVVQDFLATRQTAA